MDKTGRPGLPTRLMAGLHLLQHAKGLSDDAVCAQWLENPYFQVFCGETYFEHKLPLDRSSMTRWRGRIGQDKLEELLAETLAAALRAKAVDAGKFERITIDTTAQTKAVIVMLIFLCTPSTAGANRFGGEAGKGPLTAAYTPTSERSAPSGLTHLDKLEKLASLRSSGAIDGGEFERMKADLLKAN